MKPKLAALILSCSHGLFASLCALLTIILPIADSHTLFVPLLLLIHSHPVPLSPKRFVFAST